MTRSVVSTALLLSALMGSTMIDVAGMPAHAQIYVQPAPTIERTFAPTIERSQPAPTIERYPSPTIERAQPSPNGYRPDPANCDYGCRSRLYQEAYMRKQCLESGNRYYYCRQTGLTPAQVDAIEAQRRLLRGQYGQYRNGIFYSN
jgi:hypothetical protein